MDREQAMALVKQSLDRFGNISLPTLEHVVAEHLGPSEAGQVTSDPALKAAQMSALSRMQSIVDGGGVSQPDRIAQQQMLNQAAATESAGRSRIDEQMQARGMGNSGSALAMQLQNQQGAADRSSANSAEFVKQAQQRYLQSILSQGQMAGQMRGQDFGEKFQAAQARDSIARYNADAAGKAQYYNAGLAQQQFGNQMQQASAMANASNGVAAQYNQNAQDNRLFWSGAGVAANEAVRPEQDYAFDPNTGTFHPQKKSGGY